MREADFGPAWSGCRQNPPKGPRIDRLEVRHDGECQAIAISSRVTALIGTNGAGKTSLLATFAKRLGASVPKTQREHSASVCGNFRGADFIANGTTAPPANMTALYLDTSAECHALRNYATTTSDFDDQLATAGWRDAGMKELDRLKYACGRPYSSLRIAEVEIADAASSIEEVDGDDDRGESPLSPYFEVTLNGITYDTRSMGFGELCLAYLIWRLWRLEKGTFVFLDEPDAHLSPAARRALVNLFGLVAHEQQLTIVFSSHFVEPLQSLQESEIGLVTSSHGGASAIFPAGSKRLVIRELGLALSQRLLVVVEDVDAQETVYQVVNRWGRASAGVIDVQIGVGGASDLLRFKDLFPTQSRICRLLVVLDGDKKIEHGNADVLFLPAGQDPIADARRALPGREALLATRLGIEDTILRAALKKVEHVNHHDFCRSLLHAIPLEGRPTSAIRQAMISLWLEDPAVAQEGEQLGAKLSAAVATIPLDL